MTEPYYRKGLNVFKGIEGEAVCAEGVMYVRASSATKAEDICRALNGQAKRDASYAACGWPVEWANG